MCAPGGYTAPADYETAAVRMNICTPGGYTAPAGYKKPPSGWTCGPTRGYTTPAGYEKPPARWTCARLEGRQPLSATKSCRLDGRVRAPQRHQHTGHSTPSAHTGEQGPSDPGHRTQNTQHNTPRKHTREQEPSGRGHRARNAAGRARTPVNASQVPQDTAHATQHTERAHRSTGAKWPRTPHTQHNTPTVCTGEQEPSGPGHRTCNATHRAGTTVNRSQVAQDTARATQRTERAHRWTGAKLPRMLHAQHNTTSEHTGDGETDGPERRTSNTTRQGVKPMMMIWNRLL